MIKRIRRFLRDTENIKLIIFAVLAMAVASNGLPLALPQLKAGAVCVNLPNAPGGNRQSLLAYPKATSPDPDVTIDQQRLELDLDILTNGVTETGDPIAIAGQPLRVRVTFINKDIGPLTLYLLEDIKNVGPIESYENPSIVGLIFEIRPVGSDIPLRDQSTNRNAAQQLTTFPLESQFILPAHSRCYVDVEFTVDELNVMGLRGPGEFRIRAYFRNESRGTLIQAAGATATPMFPDQGVWTGTAQSREVRFRVDIE